MKFTAVCVMIIFFMGCKTAVNKTEADQRKNQLYLDNEINNFICEKGLEIQNFKIPANIDTNLTGKYGSTMHILPNILVTESGEEIKGNIQIEFIEILSIKDMVLSGLSTISDRKILQSGGMIYINALADGKELKLKNNNAIFTSVPTNNYNPDMEYYQSTFTSSGINWISPTKTENNKLEENLIAIPFDELNLGERRTESDFPRKLIERFESEQYSESFFATYEFKERIDALAYYTIPKFQLNNQKDKIFDLYFNNVNENLSVVDRKVYEFIKEDFKIQPYDKYDKYYINDIIKKYEEFIKLDLTKPINFSEFGIKKPITLDKIQKLKIDSEIKNKLIVAFNSYQRKDDKNGLSNFTDYYLRVKKLGWQNIDCLLLDGVEESVINIVVENNLEVNKLIFIIPKRKIFIQSIPNQKVYNFPKDFYETYNSLPIGEEAVVISFGKKDNKYFYGFKKFTISKQMEVRIKIKETMFAKIKENLEMY